MSIFYQPRPKVRVADLFEVEICDDLPPHTMLFVSDTDVVMLSNVDKPVVRDLGCGLMVPRRMLP